MEQYLKRSVVIGRKGRGGGDKYYQSDIELTLIWIFSEAVYYNL